jgi:hypothetical protein
MINQFEDVLEESSKCKAKLSEANEELRKSKEEEKRLNLVMQGMTRQFEKRVIGLQETQKSQLHEKNISLEQAREKAANYHSDFEESDRRRSSLEKDLESQRRLSLAITTEQEISYQVLVLRS